jgi:F0F1-type ATP synthase assembly protein I
MVKKVNTMQLGLQMGFITAIPLVIFLILGVVLDKELGVFPLCTILGIILSFIVTALIVYRIIIPYVNKKVNNKK